MILNLKNTDLLNNLLKDLIEHTKGILDKHMVSVQLDFLEGIDTIQTKWIKILAMADG